jgi:HlyD family secretion protein
MKALFLVLLVGCVSAPSSEELPPLAEASRGEFDHTLTVTGELKAVESTKVSTSFGGKITKLAEEGSMVAEGDIVVRFDTTETEREIATLLADIDLKAGQIDQKTIELAGNITNLRRALEKSDLALERIQLKITDSETVSRIEREEAKLDLRQSELERERAQQELDAAISKGDADVNMLRLEKRKKEDKLARQREEVEKAAVGAPTAGLVILGQTWRGGKIAEGDQLWRGMTIMEIPDLSEMEVLALVHEVDAAKVEEAQKAEVRLDAVPGAVFTGSVKKKARLAKTKRAESEVKYFDVNVALDTTDDVMKPGMTSKVDLVIEHLTDVLTVPREALTQREGRWVVFVPDGKSWAEREVVVGARNATHVVVSEGLSDGESVFLGPPDGHRGTSEK